MSEKGSCSLSELCRDGEFIDKISGASGIVKKAELVGDHLHIEFEPELVDAIKEFNKVNFDLSC